MVLVDGDARYYGVSDADPDVHGSGCLVGVNANETGPIHTDPQGRRFSGHWVVPPGREVNPTIVTRFMKVPFDPMIHYIAVHLHPFAESLELRDLTEGRTVYISRARPSEGKIDLDHVDSHSSPEGIPLHKDHEYELTSVYNNTSERDQDSMAVMYLYVLDKQFRRPELQGRRPPPFC